jgi:four helix bundle suffix protein
LSNNHQIGDDDNPLPRHGGYRNLKSFQLAQLIYDLSVRFCNLNIDRRSRTHDQMVQAARSGVQNIAEGSKVSGTSKSLEIRLTGVARASLEELRLDYEDFLRQRDLPLWPWSDPRRKEIIDRRFASADDVDSWIGRIVNTEISIEKADLARAMISANTTLVLIGVCSSLLGRQINSQEKHFQDHGGASERRFKRRRRKINSEND